MSSLNSFFIVQLYEILGSKDNKAPVNQLWLIKSERYQLKPPLAGSRLCAFATIAKQAKSGIFL